jgi:outer membrane protein OmpA-like peptidoglycan-associated protein
MTDKRIYMIPNDLWRKNMRTYRKISIGSIRRLTWWLSAVAMALVCLAGGSFAPALGETKALRVIAVQTELDLGDRASGPTGPDYHINGGESEGIQISMLLDVYRPVRVHNRFNEKDYNIKILIGQIIVLRVFPDSAIARLQSLEPHTESPLVTNRAVMIGDHLLPRPEAAAPPANISLPSSILFNFDSWRLKPEAFNILSNLSGIIKQRQDQDLVIEGHTCNRGSDKYNITLSRKRANSVSDYIIGSGVIRKERLYIIGYGERFPISPNDTEEGRQHNRRVAFRFIPTGTPVPPIDSGSKADLANLRRN